MTRPRVLAGRTRTRPVLFAIACAAVLLGGCAAGLPSTRALLSGDAATAERLARESTEQHPEDARAWRDLGIALYEKGDIEPALDPLRRAISLSPQDRQTHLFLARSLDRLDRVPEALAAYGRYASLASGSQAEVARARIEQIRRRQIAEEVHRAIAREDSLSGLPIPENTVAVPEFANPSESEALRPLAKGLAVIMLTDLSQVSALRLLERARLSVLAAEISRANESIPDASATAASAESIEESSTIRGQQQRLARLVNPASGKPYYEGEDDGVAGPQFAAAIRLFQKDQGLAPDGIAGPLTRSALEEAWSRSTRASSKGPVFAFALKDAPRIGRLLRARHVVQGSVLPLGPERVLLEADLEDLLAAPLEQEQAREPVEGRLRDVLSLQKRLLFQILDQMRVPVTKEERKRIERPQTRDYEAFLAFCRGLEFEDRGLVGEAFAAYQDALARDSGFALARSSAAAITVDSGTLEGVESVETGSLDPVDSDLQERAQATGRRTGMIPVSGEISGVDTRNPVTNRQETGRVVVEGSLPGRQP